MIKVYRHRRNDTNEIFYVGIGKTEKRAYSIHSRSKFWKSIVNKYGYSVEIVCTCDTWQEACQIEQYLIKYYGRRDLGTGTLVNLTDGGEGVLGHKPSEETLKKKSEAMKGFKHSEESKSKMSEVKRGKKRSEEVKSKMSEYMKGKNNPMYGLTGEKNPNYGKKHSEETKAKMGGKTIICTETGNIWHTVGSCAIDNGLNRSTLKGYLNGRLRNKTTFKYL